jgi:hypothetical protein
MHAHPELIVVEEYSRDVSPCGQARREKSYVTTVRDSDERLALASEGRDFPVGDDGVVRVRPVDQTRFEWRSRTPRQAMERFADQPEVKHRRGIAGDRGEVRKRHVIRALIGVFRRTCQGDLAAACEGGDVENVRSLGGSKFSYEVAECRNTPSIVSAVEMVSAEAKEHLGLTCGLPVLSDEILHHSFATL